MKTLAHQPLRSLLPTSPIFNHELTYTSIDFTHIDSPSYTQGIALQHGPT
jgi:hypothetical protein